VNDLKETTIEKIIELAARNNGFIRTRDLLVERISKTHLATMVKLGHLERVKQGLYRLADLETVVYRAPSDAAMCGFSRRISQSGKSPHQPPPSFSSLPEGFITLVVAPKKCTAQLAHFKKYLYISVIYDILN
jgi:hypothetical protein